MTASALANSEKVSEGVGRFINIIERVPEVETNNECHYLPNRPVIKLDSARLVNSTLKVLNMPDLKVILWSKSTTALWWIKEFGNWSVFVANRVKEIRQLTQIQSWEYVPGKMIIADLLSRGGSPRQMLNSRWWKGRSRLK
ncbi:uncharacterized protein TNCV_749311 [Trichonephila clavipes]|nr:uncharacterized protein TNCV_749311 [Trichonephila clavipes]